VRRIRSDDVLCSPAGSRGPAAHCLAEQEGSRRPDHATRAISTPRGARFPETPSGYLGIMATRIDVAEKRETRSISQPGLDPRPRDVFTFGEPSRIPFQIQAVLRSVASGFFDGRDPSCSVASTLTKIGGVVLAVTIVVLGLLGVTGALLLWAFRAAFG